MTDWPRHAMASSDDRRRRRRLPLHWPVRLFRQPGRSSAESITENLSSEGFYCITAERFKPGERLNTSQAGYSFGKCLFVALGADLDTRRPAGAMLPVPADGAGGLRLQ